MATKKFTVYLYQSTEPWDADDPVKMLCFKAENSDYAVFIGEAEVEVEIPEMSRSDLVISQIAAAQAKIEKERADSQLRVNRLLDRISKLQAIGHEAAE